MHKTLKFVTLALFGLLLLTGCGPSDKSTRYISKDAIGVISLNTTQLVKKVGLSMLSGSPIFKEMTGGKGADTSSFNIEDMGIRYLSTVYAYAVPDMRLSSKARFIVILPLQDPAKFSAFLKKEFAGATITQKDKLTLASLNEHLCIGWDDQTAIIAAAPGNNEWMEGRNAAPATANTSVILTEEIQKTFAMSEDQSIAGNKKFAELQKAGHDISLWLNYESLMNSLPQEQIGTPGAILASQKKLLKDAYVAGGIDFDNGKITGDATYYFNESARAIAESLEGKSSGDELLKKVQGKQLNLMMSYHINPQGIRTMLDSIGVLPLATVGLKEAGLDLDDILNAFSGDFLLAVTDFSVTTESQSYTMGGSSVNYTKPVPSFKATLSFKLKDKAAFDKLMQTAVAQQAVTSSGPGRYSAGFIHLATDGEYAVLSNEAAVSEAYLKGSGASFNIPAEVKNSTSGFFLDIKNSIAAVPLDLMYGKQDTAVFHDGKNLLETISAHGGKVQGDHTDFHFEINFINKKENSLLQLIQFGQKVAAAEEAGTDSYEEAEPEADSMPAEAPEAI